MNIVIFIAAQTLHAVVSVQFHVFMQMINGPNALFQWRTCIYCRIRYTSYDEHCLREGYNQEMRIIVSTFNSTDNFNFHVEATHARLKTLDSKRTLVSQGKRIWPSQVFNFKKLGKKLGVKVGQVFVFNFDLRQQFCKA